MKINSNLLVLLVVIVVVTVIFFIGIDILLYFLKEKYGNNCFSEEISQKSIFNKLKGIYNQKSKLISTENYYSKFDSITNSNVLYYIYDLWDRKDFIATYKMFFLESLILSKEKIIYRSIYYTRKINYFLSMLTPILLCAISYFYFFDKDNVVYFLVAYFIFFLIKLILMFFRYKSYFFVENFIDQHLNINNKEKTNFLKFYKYYIFEDFGFLNMFNFFWKES